jgi:hypothetical protein
MTKTRKLTTTNTNRKGETHHFFVSSGIEWRVGTDVAALITRFKKSDWPFNVWMVPGAENTAYQIENYAPQVEGAVWLGFYGHDTK